MSFGEHGNDILLIALTEYVTDAVHISCVSPLDDPDWLINPWNGLLIFRNIGCKSGIQSKFSRLFYELL
jgi:hypothetical protein